MRSLLNGLLIVLVWCFVGCAGTQDAGSIAWKLLVSACRVVEKFDVEAQ